MHYSKFTKNAAQCFSFRDNVIWDEAQEAEARRTTQEQLAHLATEADQGCIVSSPGHRLTKGVKLAHLATG
ncbi:hypothetical protein DPMN_065794 [Dreissena polymorpha]|uniref:Uncharacterized protein n=1 Tax=Dreissena polymorpha TaxID=45954 RepID=A0A9D3YSU1_DREPO|nr:hypothetical protein DPMN_065794 [Dreissena polymorpha]